MNRRQRIIVSITGIFLVLLLLVGLTYGYFLTKVTGNTNDKSISVTTANLAIVYGDDNGSIIGDGETIIPGTTFEPKTFTVTNEGSTAVDYLVVIDDIKITDLATSKTTTFESNDFTYTLTCETGCNGVTTPTTLPINDGVLIGNRIETEQTQTYSFTLTYNETGLDQSNDMNKLLEGKLNIKDANDTSYNPYNANKYSLAYNIINNAMNVTEEQKVAGYAELVATPPTKINEEISGINGTSHELENDITMTVSSSDQKYYWTYGTGYTTDETTGSFSLTSVQTCKYSESGCISDLVSSGEKIYVISDTAYYNTNSSNTARKTTELSHVYRITTAPAATGSSNIELTYRVVTNKSESTLSITPDNLGKSYYYRGNVKNNYVEFNDMCWRIVRIEGDGSVKLTLAAQKACSAITAADRESAFIGVGYSGRYEEEYDDSIFTDNGAEVGAIIRTEFDKWLNGTLEDGTTKRFSATAKQKLKSTNICIGDTTTEYNSREESYDEYGAIEDYGGWDYENKVRLVQNKTASLICNSKGFSKNEYQIYPLTADEVAFAGASTSINNNNNYNYNYYLFENTNNKYWWTSSVAYYDVYPDAEYVFVAGKIINTGLAHADTESGYFAFSTDKLSFRPAISLIPGITISNGDGTIGNPYIVN